jgi:heme A synthase
MRQSPLLNSSMKDLGMSRFSKYAWFVVLFLILVILWGAVVRATGSGAGCGNHWPTCDGQIIPQPESIERMIEFSHRVTSAFSGFLVLGMLIWVFRVDFPANKKFIRWMAVMTFIFILIEGGLGAALVRFELVGENASSARAIVIALHLGNTLILLAFATLTAWASQLQKPRYFTGMSPIKWGIIVALVGYIILSAMGAITALGDTLFPVESLAEGIQQDLDPTAHFLIELRIWHPIVAIIVSSYLFAYGYRLRNSAYERLVNIMFALIILQVTMGFINVILLAPIWMQILHLLIADSLWIVLVILAGTILTSEGKG